MHAEETEIKAVSLARYHQRLLGLRRRRLLQDLRHFEQRLVLRLRDRSATDGTKETQLALVRRLDGRHAAGLPLGDGNQLGGTTFGTIADVQVIADQMQKRLLAHKRSRTQNGIAVPQRLGLFEESQPRGLGPGRRQVPLLLAGSDHQANVVDPRRHHLTQNQLQGTARMPRSIDHRLQWQMRLVFPGRCDDRFADSHAVSTLLKSSQDRLRRRLPSWYLAEKIL